VTEYGIGLDVFDRSPSFEPRMDSIVRTETSRLRQKLSEYYRTQGQSETIVIELPQRSYVPVLTRREIEAAKPEAEAEKPKAPRRLWWTAAAIAAVLGIAALILIAVRNRPATAPLTSLVVLPFENYSANRDAEYLADGITEELTNELAQRRDLRVVARTSAFAFKGKAVDVREIGRRLNAEAALEGSVSKTGDVVRLTAQLNRTSDGYHLWSHSFEAPFEEIAGVQAQITQSVETALLKTPGRRRRQAAPPTRRRTTFTYGQAIKCRGRHRKGSRRAWSCFKRRSKRIRRMATLIAELRARRLG
jgi:adenylate cyclase